MADPELEQTLRDRGFEVGSGHESSGTVAYKPGWEFLRRGLWSERILRSDTTNGYGLTVYDQGGKRFAVVDLFPSEEEIISGNLLRRLESTSIIDFNYFKFDPIVGYLIGAEIEGGERKTDLMVHEYTGGIGFDALIGCNDSEIERRLSSIMAKALAEMHGSRITYYLTVPPNFRFQYKDTIAMNPHLSIKFDTEEELEEKGEGGRLVDLMVFLKTNHWIPSEEKFLEIYLEELQKHGGSSSHLRREPKEIKESIDYFWKSWVEDDPSGDFLPLIDNVWKYGKPFDEHRDDALKKLRAGN